MDIPALLQTHQIEANNPGAFAGEHGWICHKAATPFNSINPSTAKPISAVQPACADCYETVLKSSQAAFLHWRNVPAPKRGAVIREIAERLRAQKDALGSLVALEMGKSKQEGDGEVQEMIDMADFAVGQSRMLYGKTMHSERPWHRMYEQWHPLGVVGVITAFNFPVAVWAWNAFLAAICGNTVIWRPSAKTPLCAIAVQRLIEPVLQQHACVGVFNLCISEDSTLSKKLVDDERVSLISFTGSSAVGREVGATVARRFGKSILELSGNNALILDDSADLNLALPAILFGAIGTAGQRCTTTRRVFVHRSQMRAVSEQLTEAYRDISIGDPLDPNHLMGPLIDQDAVTQFEAAMSACRARKARILHGGRVIDRPGFFVEPTLVIAEHDWPIVQQETFAPILYLIAYDTLDEAMQMHNDVKQGLSSAIFTQTLQHAEYFLSAKGSDCGIANVNIGTSGAEIGGAFGGEKETGGGRESGSDAWQGYMRRQTNTINWGQDLPLAQGIQFDLK